MENDRIMEAGQDAAKIEIGQNRCSCNGSSLIPTMCKRCGEMVYAKDDAHEFSYVCEKCGYHVKQIR